MDEEEDDDDEEEEKGKKGVSRLYTSYMYSSRLLGPYRKLQTEFFPLRFMAQARSARAINRRGKYEDP